MCMPGHCLRESPRPTGVGALVLLSSAQYPLESESVRPDFAVFKDMPTWIHRLLDGLWPTVMRDQPVGL